MLSDWLPPLLLAPVVGSFLGVLVVRLPAGRPVALARSACDSCGATLQARDLVPLLSYAVLRGRCRRCHAPIGRFHLAIELACLLVAAVVVAVWAVRASAANFMQPDFMQPDWMQPAWSGAWIWSGCVLGWAALALAWIDWRCFRLPDLLTLPLLLLGLASCAALDPDALANHAAACLAGYLGFRAVAWTYRRVRGRDGLGQGDAKLLAAGGAWLGLAALPTLVLLAAVATLVIVLLRGGGRLRPDLAVPFGPGLALSSWALWLWITVVPVAISG